MVENIVNEEVAHKVFDSGDLIKNLLVAEPHQIMALIEYPLNLDITFSEYGLSELNQSELLLKCDNKGKKKEYISSRNKYPFEFVDKVFKILKLMNLDFVLYEKKCFPLLVVIDNGDEKHKIGFAVAPKVNND